MRLTKLDLFKLSRRIDEIIEIIDACTDRDDDIIETLDLELDIIMDRLKTSLRLSRIAESGLKLITRS